MQLESVQAIPTERPVQHVGEYGVVATDTGGGGPSAPQLVVEGMDVSPSQSADLFGAELFNDDGGHSTILEQRLRRPTRASICSSHRSRSPARVSRSSEILPSEASFTSLAASRCAARRPPWTVVVTYR